MSEETKVGGEKKVKTEITTSDRQNRETQQTAPTENNNPKVEMNNLPPPKPLESTSAPAEDWNKWKSRFKIYLEAANLKTESEVRKVAILLHTIGEESQTIAETFTYTNAEGQPIPEEEITLEMLIGKFDDFYIPKRNVTYERRKFFTTMQKEEQNIDDYVAELKKKAKTCEYGNLTEELIKDQLVGGIREETLRERLLRTENLNLQKALNICRAAETAKKQLTTFNKTEEESIAILRKKNKEPTYQKREPNRIEYKPREKTDQRQLRRETNRVEYTREGLYNRKNCSRCGTTHVPRNCPAYGKTCMSCEKIGHFARVCRANRVQELETDSQDSEGDSLFTEVLINKLSNEKKGNTLETEIKIQGVKVKCRLDTGSQANVLPYEIWEQLPNTKLKQTKNKLMTYTRQEVTLIGEGILKCEKNKKIRYLKFLITKEKYGAILGLQACCQELELISTCQVNTLVNKQTKHKESSTLDIIKKYQDVFQGLGRLRGNYHITLKEGATPKIHAPRKIPFAIHEQVKEELQRMEQQGVIKKVKEPTEWVNPIVIVKKRNGKIRICLDPRELNEAMRRSHYKMPTFEEISSQMKGAKYFTTLDGSRAFLQKKLDHQSSMLCTFATPFGRYRFLRLPYGIKAAPEVFQKEMSEMTEALKNTEPFVDDIIIWGETMEQHNRNLEKFLKVAKKNGLKLEKSKMQLAKKQVKYLGHLITEEGIKIDEDKKRAILEMPKPQSKEELQRFLGMTNFLMKYVPNLATIGTTLRELLKKDVVWSWHEAHDKALQEIQRKLTEAPTLAYYNNDKEVEITVDASPNGLGAMIGQDNKPIAYASTTLTPTQKRYAHIEKELLAVTYACEKFHQYVYGKRFIVYTDHKPLIAMARKPINELTARIQRLFMRLQRYDVELKYKPGKEMYVTDTLSRATLKVQECQTEEEDCIIRQLTKSKNQRIQQVIEETKVDQELTKLKEYLIKGWPRYQSKIPGNLRAYWREKDELHYTGEGLVMRGEQIVIPKKLRTQMLKKLHDSHQGITNTKKRAKTTIYWPSMNQQIEEMINTCNTCMTFQNNKPRQPYLTHEIPPTPWSKVAADFFQWNQKTYLQIIDYYSKYIEVQEVESTQANKVIRAIKAIFARHGIPHNIVTDGGPPFNGEKTRQFFRSWQVEHVRTSPHHPQSNGEVERSIQTIKKMFKKTIESNKDPFLGLLTIRTTPVMDSPYTPAQLLMGRNLETLIPRKNENDITKQDHQKYQKTLKQKAAELQKKSGKARKQEKYKIGQRVMVKKEDNRWHRATVVKENAPRSYKVKTERGRIITRNQKHIREDKRSYTWSDEEEDESITINQSWKDKESYENNASTSNTKSKESNGNKARTLNTKSKEKGRKRKKRTE